MKPPEAVFRRLVLQWLDKAERDFEAAEQLLTLRQDRFREIVAFHCQQAVEKYLKAVLVRHQIECPKTHDLTKLLGRVAMIHPELAGSLRDADVLTPFGVEVRYPSDAPELLPGGETEALEIARRAREAVTQCLAPYLSGAE